MAGSSALKKITTRAKAIRKKKPGMKWASAIKQAGADYRGGRISGTRKKKVAKRKPAARKKSVAGVKRKRPAVRKRAISGMTVGSHMSHAKAQLKEEIGWLEAGKFTATTAKARKALQKRINEKKRIYRKLV